MRRAIDDLEQQAAPPLVHSPPRLSASQVVHQAQDPRGAAIDLLRPLPRRPSPAAARGTAFHAWLESRYDSTALLDLEDVLDLGEDEGPHRDDLALREAFDSSQWAQRTPIVVEHPVQTRVGEIAVRGVIDAVFEDPDSPENSDSTDSERPGARGVIIVDWKTGRVPRPAQLRETFSCRCTGWPGTNARGSRWSGSARRSTSWPTTSPTRCGVIRPANGSRRCWGFSSEGAVPPQSRIPDLPAGTEIVGSTTECASGGCWREVTLAPAPHSSPQALADRLGLEADRATVSLESPPSALGAGVG